MKITAVFMLLFACVSLSAKEFSFEYTKGDKYRILSTVDESVHINGRFSHQADILNKIAIEIIDTKDGAGFHDAIFQTSERASGSGRVYQWGRDYTSMFWRDARGAYDIDPMYYMPVVRSVPYFPDTDIGIGDTWVADGAEVHDFRANFGIPDAYHFPITVSYEYIGPTDLDGRSYDLIGIKYTIFFKSSKRYPGTVYPYLITGYSDQRLYWDSENGRAYAYEEEFDIIFTLSSGDTVEYQGTAEAKVIEALTMDKEKIAEEIREELAEIGIEETSVRVDEEGVTLSLENIQFMPDSSVLIPYEKEKIRRIGEILRSYSDRDILISGHTALAGTWEGRQQLSEERASAVGNYLLQLNAVRDDQIITRGFGAERPIAPNDREENMRKNRRVEITILEN